MKARCRKDCRFRIRCASSSCKGAHCAIAAFCTINLSEPLYEAGAEEETPYFG